MSSDPQGSFRQPALVEMRQQPATRRVQPSLVSSGEWNRWVGWGMLLTGWLIAAVLDPWLFSVGTASEFAQSLKPAARHAQGVVIGMGMLQLAMAHLLATASFERRVRQVVAIVIMVGASLYMAGYGMGLLWPVAHWLVLLGSLINVSGFVWLICIGARGRYATQLKMILPVVCFGMCLDFAAGVMEVMPPASLVEHLGEADGVQLRMMRLARVAAIALPVLTLLFYELVRPSSQRDVAMSFGGTALAAGAAGMPVILAVSCFFWLQAKYLLPLPAMAVSIGVFLAFHHALRQSCPLEWFGWGLIAVSLCIGMLMGLYAFEGPFATPEFLGEYNHAVRRLSRVAHSYFIVLGTVAIFLARESRQLPLVGDTMRRGTVVFMAGCITTLAGMLSQVPSPGFSWILSIGPVLVVLGAIVCLADSRGRRSEVLLSGGAIVRR